MVLCVRGAGVEGAISTVSKAVVSEACDLRFRHKRL